jgi:leader peptidase (prepilin peptidase)/N-methyltransferase
MGMGDVKLAGLIGLFVGYLSWGRVFSAFFVAFLAGAIVGIALMIAGRAGRKTAIPFGPFMAIGAIVATLFGGPIVRLWHR